MFVFLYARPLFTAREVEHMRDVKALLGLVYTLMYVTGAAVALYAAWGFRREGLRFLRRVSMAGAVGTVGLVVAGIVLGLGFPVLFTLFHQISFRNDYWVLNPSEHFLVVLFPQRFWLEATLLLAFVTIAEAVTIWGVSPLPAPPTVGEWRGRNRRRLAFAAHLYSDKAEAPVTPGLLCVATYVAGLVAAASAATAPAAARHRHGRGTAVAADGDGRKDGEQPPAGAAAGGARRRVVALGHGTEHLKTLRAGLAVILVQRHDALLCC